MDSSKLFLSYVTCIDYAIIDRDGRVVGGSVSPRIEVSGKIDPKEKVVVDFSRIKKEIKSLIDDKETGFDHKLWILPGYSNMFERESPPVNILQIVTPIAVLEMPKNAVRKFETLASEDLLQTYEEEISTYLERCLNELHPGVEIQVTVELDETPMAPIALGWTFRYTHGLKDSTSWGCQNIAHGHLSYVDFILRKDALVSELPNVAELYSLVIEMNNAVFINRENLVEDTNGAYCIQYTTPRGFFTAMYRKSAYNTIILDTETTVEYIVEWFVNKNRELLRRLNVEKVYLSEGLSKGAVKYVG